jgi:hypothetical protein
MDRWNKPSQAKSNVEILVRIIEQTVGVAAEENVDYTRISEEYSTWIIAKVTKRYIQSRRCFSR